MIINTQKTIWKIDIEVARDVGINYKTLPNTTLNERFGVYPDIEIPDGEYPTIKYYTIGVGGYSTIDNIQEFNTNTHTVIHGSLYEPIPFVLRPLNNDLTEEQKRNYIFRKVIQINETEYAGYYLKKIPSINVEPGIMQITKGNDINRLSMLDTTTDTILYPIPVSKRSSINNDNKYVTKTAKLEFSLTPDEMMEIRNVNLILFGENRNITEIGVCTGVDMNIGGIDTSIGTQIAYFVHVDIDNTNIINSETGVSRSINIGGIEPYDI